MDVPYLYNCLEHIADLLSHSMGTESTVCKYLHFLSSQDYVKTYSTFVRILFRKGIAKSKSDMILDVKES